MDIIKFIKDIIAPKRCYSCQKEGHFLCQDCLQKRQLQKEFCYVCKKESKNYFLHTDCKKGTIFENFEKIIILLHYNDSYIAKLIKDSKFNKKKDILEDFAYYLLDLLRKNENRKEEYTIVVPPMYFLKKWKRGYNHSELLGKYIAKIGGIPYDFSLVKKIKYTRQQSHLSKEQREKNILHSFVCTQYGKEKIQGKNIILVDDVISTGATLGELAKILKQNGAKKIIALVIASD